MPLDALDRKILSAKADLILEEPFYGALVGRLPLRRTTDPRIPTAATDGRVIYYNAEWFATLSVRHITTVLMHEIGHAAAGHPWRRDTRDHTRWAKACDYPVNEFLVKSGHELPGKPLHDPKLYGMSAEQIYARLPGNADHDHQLCCAVLDCPESAGTDDAKDGPSRVELKADWEVAVAQAATLAKAQGKLPQAMEAALDQLRRSRVDYASYMRRFIQTARREDYTWKRPNPRYAAAGMYLPSLYSESMPPVVIAADSSASISDEEFQVFGGDIDAIITDCRPERTYVVYCDAKVQYVDEFEPTEPVTVTRHGRGGTDFRPPFEWVAEQGIEPACLVYLTDMAGTFPGEAPPYPTLFVSTTRDPEAPAWAEVIYMDIC